ncbi:MAG: peptidase S1 [Pseudomonadota bacterium]
MLKLTLGAFVLAATGLCSAAAQDYSLSPAYGSVSLEGGFTPDPYTVSLDAGGPIDAGAQIGGDCVGYVADAPDFRLQFSAGSLPLILSVASTEDTTLVINGPDESWHCDDDGGDGLNPSVRFSSPQSGQYDIWVGAYGGGTPDATLYISEVTSQ